MRAADRVLAPIAIGLIAFTTLVISVRYGAFVAGGSDSYGYLSEARLWTRGWPIIHEPLVNQVRWPLSEWAFTPLAYKPGVAPATIVPVYPIGYPLIMAVFILVFGSGAEMFVVPLAATGLVAAAGAIGRRVAGDLVGVLTALLVATSPIAVFQSLQPMSDVPAAFFWTASALCVLSSRAWCHAMVAVVVTAATLVRPNLAPLAGPLLGIAYWLHRDRKGSAAWIPVVAVIAGALCGAALTAWANTVMYGSPLETGYGSATTLYRFQFLSTNLRRYSAWIAETETPLLVLAIAGAVAMLGGTLPARGWASYTIAVAVLVFGSYAFYSPFGDWTYLRFLLPALPGVFICYLCVSRNAKVVTLAGMVLAGAHIYFNARNDLLGMLQGEQRYADVGQYVDSQLPPNAVLLSKQQSGSISYYSGRKIVRYDWIRRKSLDDALDDLRRLGYKPYIVLEDWEEPIFRERFATSPIAALDWPPNTEITNQIGVRVFDPDRR